MAHSLQSPRELYRSVSVSAIGSHARPITANPIGRSASIAMVPAQDSVQIHPVRRPSTAGRRASTMHSALGAAGSGTGHSKAGAHAGFEQTATENLEDLSRFMLPVIQAMRNHQLVGVSRPWLYQAAANSAVVSKKDLQQLVSCISLCVPLWSRSRTLFFSHHFVP
jgi:hypothetical protein